MKGQHILWLLIYLPFLSWASSPIYYVHSDHLGTPQKLSDDTGTVVWEAEYEPFGEVTVDDDPDLDGHGIEFNLRFPGQYYDKYTGANYNYYRDYDPSIGRYTQNDPIGLQGGLNTYGYVFQNPLRGIDPLGLATAVVVGGPTSENPAGHVAVATTGHGLESFGTQTPSGSSLTDYLENQAKYRSSAVYIIPTTPEQEAAIRDRLSQFPVELPGVPSFDSDDTCATRTNSALSAAGLYDPSNPWATLGSALGFHSPLPEASGSIGNYYSRGNSISVPQGGGASIPDSLSEFNP